MTPPQAVLVLVAQPIRPNLPLDGRFSLPPWHRSPGTVPARLPLPQAKAHRASHGTGPPRRQKTARTADAFRSLDRGSSRATWGKPPRPRPGPHVGSAPRSRSESRLRTGPAAADAPEARPGSRECPDHESVWTWTDRTAGRSRTIGAQLSPESGDT